MAWIWAYMCYWSSTLKQIPSSNPTHIMNTPYMFKAVKKWLSFELIFAVHIDYTGTIHFVCQYPHLMTLYVQYTKTLAIIWAYMCSRLRVHSNHSVCPSIPKFTDLICSVHKDPSRQQVAFIWAYMCSILRVHINHSLWPSVPKFTYLICSLHQYSSRQKVASIWAYMWSNHLLCPSIPQFTYLI